MTDQLVEAVAEDTDLLPSEKETTFRVAKDETSVTVFSAEAGVMRRLLSHPAFEVAELRVENDSTVSHVAPNDFTGGTITGVRGTMPVSLVTIAPSPRASSDHANVVSEQVLRTA